MENQRLSVCNGIALCALLFSLWFLSPHAILSSVGKVKVVQDSPRLNVNSSSLSARPSKSNLDCNTHASSTRSSSSALNVLLSTSYNGTYLPWTNQFEGTFLSEASYQSLRDDCEWTQRSLLLSSPASETAVVALEVKHYANDSVYASFLDRMMNGCPDPKTINEQCPRDNGRIATSSIRAMRCSIDGWRIERLGPFRSTGGYDWWSVEAWGDVGGLEAEINANGGGVHVLGSAISPVDASGQPLHYPPIHVHHFHLSNGYVDMTRHRPLIELHGDSACHTDQGGMGCTVRMLPRGLGYRINKGLVADFELNDVRPPGSPEIEYWLEVGIKWSARPIKSPVAKINFGNPMQRRGPGVYGIPMNESSVFWFSSTIKMSGEFVLGQQVFHAHQARADALWVFSGPRVTKAALGLVALEAQASRLKYDTLFQSRVTKPPFLPQRHGLTLSSVKLHIAGKAAENELGAPVCFIDAPCLEDGFDRKSRLLCRPWTVKKGDQVLIVAFNRATPQSRSVGMGTGIERKETFPQHAILRGLFKPAGHERLANPAEYYYGNCDSTNGPTTCPDMVQGCSMSSQGTRCVGDSFEPAL